MSNIHLYDVIIIGGGPSGSTVATLLARNGHQVLLLEKEKFPREHIGESLIPMSYFILEKLGVIEDLKKIAPRKPGVNFVDSNGKSQSLWCFKSVVKDKSYLSFHVVRSAFDKLLLDNSRKNGARVMEETLVKNVVLDKSDGIVEVHTKNKNGKQEIFHSKFIIDASGQNTFLGTKLGVKKSYKDLDRVAVWSHWSNTNFDTSLKQGAIKIVYSGGDKKGWIWVIPISADILSIGVVINNSYLKQEKEKLQNNKSTDWKNDLYIQETFSSPAVKRLIEGAQMDHKVQINGDYSYYCENKYGSNYAFVGDAGAFLDPIFSSGIFVGMQSAEMVANAVHQKLTTADGHTALVKAYEEIGGALKVIEKFIRLFYTPEVLNFATLGRPEELLSYHKTEAIYSIFHYLLAGDFFKNHEKYSEFIDMLRDQKTLEKFQNLINHSKGYDPDSHCGEQFEEMYGEMTHKVEFDTKTFI